MTREYSWPSFLRGQYGPFPLAFGTSPAATGRGTVSDDDGETVHETPSLAPANAVMNIYRGSVGSVGSSAPTDASLSRADAAAVATVAKWLEDDNGGHEYIYPGLKQGRRVVSLSPTAISDRTLP